MYGVAREIEPVDVSAYLSRLAEIEPSCRTIFLLSDNPAAVAAKVSDI